MPSKARYLARKVAGVCTSCGTKPAVVYTRCGLCKDSHRAPETKAYRQRLKDKVYTAYGGYLCKCCGETIREFLTLDHINNDGASHRREIYGTRVGGGGQALYRWIIKNSFPPTFQILCSNCNIGRFLNKGICPHKIGKEVEAKINPANLASQDVITL